VAVRTLMVVMFDRMLFDRMRQSALACQMRTAATVDQRMKFVQVGQNLEVVQVVQFAQVAQVVQKVKSFGRMQAWRKDLSRLWRDLRCHQKD